MFEKTVARFTFKQTSSILTWKIQALLMKNNLQPVMHFSMQSPNGLHAVSPKRSAQQISPYLKAILSRKGAALMSGTQMNDDRQAAIRYIRESQHRKK